jgi:hypothetical protein
MPGVFGQGGGRKVKVQVTVDLPEGEFCTLGGSCRYCRPHPEIWNCAICDLFRRAIPLENLQALVRKAPECLKATKEAENRLLRRLTPEELEKAQGFPTTAEYLAGVLYSRVCGSDHICRRDGKPIKTKPCHSSSNVGVECWMKHAEEYVKECEAGQ